jgi:hypothetical protein
MAAPTLKMPQKPMRVYRRPHFSLMKAAAMAPKKDPAVRSDTTLEETEAFFSLEKPSLPWGRPKSFLKDSIARTEPMTPVSKPGCVRQLEALHFSRWCLFWGAERTKEHSAHVGYAREQVHAPVLEHDGGRDVVGERVDSSEIRTRGRRNIDGCRYMDCTISIADAICPSSPSLPSHQTPSSLAPGIHPIWGRRV